MIGVSDFIVDLVQTGSTLRVHNLAPLATILESRAVLIAGSSGAASRPVEELAHSLKSVITASKKRYLMANVHERDLASVSSILPGLTSPTVMKLSRPGMYAIHSVVGEDDLSDLLRRLQAAGASGILVVPIERMVV